MRKHRKIRMENHFEKKKKTMQNAGDFCIVFFFILLTPYIISVFMHGIEAKETHILLGGPEMEIVSDIGTEKIPLDEYLCGMLADYCDRGFSEEELKAIAIILRSNLVYDLEKDVMPSYTYYTATERRNRWGDSYEANETMIRKIILETAGKILLYEGKLMEIPIFEFGEGENFETILNTYYEPYEIYMYY